MNEDDKAELIRLIKTKRYDVFLAKKDVSVWTKDGPPKQVAFFDITSRDRVEDLLRSMRAHYFT